MAEAKIQKIMNLKFKNSYGQDLFSDNFDHERSAQARHERFLTGFVVGVRFARLRAFSVACSACG
jgi:hypothetical protein